MQPIALLLGKPFASKFCVRNIDSMFCLARFVWHVLVHGVVSEECSCIFGDVWIIIRCEIALRASRQISSPHHRHTP